MTILEVVKLGKRFGGLEALKGVDLRVEAQEIVGLIGPNGAGKSTFFNVLSGVYPPTTGKVFFQGKDITGMKPHVIAEKGLVRTFQSTTLYHSLSVLENVEMGCHILAKTNTFGDIIGLPSVRLKEDKARQRAIEITKLTGLDKISEVLAKSLPHGYQRALGVAIAIAAVPKLMCLDEPLTGMNVEERKFMLKLIDKIRGEGITVLLVEHDIKAVMSICDKIMVINFGEKIAEGKPEEVEHNKDVIEAYLGKPGEIL